MLESLHVPILVSADTIDWLRISLRINDSDVSLVCILSSGKLHYEHMIASLGSFLPAATKLHSSEPFPITGLISITQNHVRSYLVLFGYNCKTKCHAICAIN